MSLNSILKDMESAPQEKAYLGKETADFAACVEKSFKNPNTLEYSEAVKKAIELMKSGITSAEMIDQGEEAAAAACGPDIVDPSVVVGAMKILEELELNKIANRG